MRGPDIPVDDLYARLELPTDAAAEAVEIAWRALLKRHHPDVAGDGSLQTAKLINIAHDWLSDPLLRQRYDPARGTGRVSWLSRRGTCAVDLCGTVGHKSTLGRARQVSEKMKRTLRISPTLRVWSD